MDRGNPLLRSLDQGLGPWLLRALAVVRGLAFWRRRRCPRGPQVIGVIKAAALGDTILLSAVMSDLRLAYPQARLILFVGATNAGLARNLLGVDQVVELPLRKPWTALRLLRACGCDWMIDADAWPRISALWATLAGARWTLGFRTGGQNRHYAFDQFIDHDGGAHELTNYRNLLRALNVAVGSAPQNPRTWLDASAVTMPDDFRRFRDRFSSLVALHFWPGGTNSTMKEWPPAHWRELMERIAADERWGFVLTGAKSDQAGIRSFIATLPGELAARVFDAGGRPLNETLRILTGTQALISVNTGILHLGAALDLPVLGLHGATNPRRWGPVGERNVSVVSRHPSAATLNLGFEYPPGNPPIMNELSVETAMAGWLELVAKNQLDFRGAK